MKDKVVVITGASSGIGLGTSREFARAGAKVVMAARTEEKIKEVEQDLLKNGFIALAVKTDVTVEKDCEELVKKTIDAFGKLDILICNAGISMRALFSQFEVDAFKKVMDVNFWGAVYCAKYALPYLLKSKGSLVGVSSVAGLHALPGRCAYSASKFALHGLFDSIRVENLKNGLHVLIMCPGFTKSNIRKTALNAIGHKQGETPRNEEKMMTPEQVAQKMMTAIRKRKREVVLTALGKNTYLFHKFWPSLVDRFAFKKLAKEPDSPFK